MTQGSAPKRASQEGELPKKREGRMPGKQACKRKHHNVPRSPTPLRSQGTPKRPRLPPQSRSPTDRGKPPSDPAPGLSQAAEATTEGGDEADGGDEMEEEERSQRQTIPSRPIPIPSPPGGTQQSPVPLPPSLAPIPSPDESGQVRREVQVHSGGPRISSENGTATETQDDSQARRRAAGLLNDTQEEEDLFRGGRSAGGFPPPLPRMSGGNSDEDTQITHPTFPMSRAQPGGEQLLCSGDPSSLELLRHPGSQDPSCWAPRPQEGPAREVEEEEEE
eukprot:Hpha_TRINITY_DN15753_c1_g1::TRINITY_DN15753_c1_g1_i1::g.39244::m.39244